MLGRPPGADAWIGNTRTTVRPSKIFTCIHWLVLPGNAYAAPIVDDPFTFGAIAAANALRDVYAMGGRPISALTILAYPAKGDLEDLRRLLKGGAEKMREADCAVVGGHSIADDEIKFGYAVTGTIHPARVKANAGARAGDALIFTKRLGTGVISTALKRGM